MRNRFSNTTKFKKSSNLTFLSGTNFGLHRSLLAQIDRALLEEVAWPTVGLGSGGLLFVDLVLKWFIEVSLSRSVPGFGHRQISYEPLTINLDVGKMYLVNTN
jgi:hypothetical protein